MSPGRKHAHTIQNETLCAPAQAILKDRSPRIVHVDVYVRTSKSTYGKHQERLSTAHDRRLKTQFIAVA